MAVIRRKTSPVHHAAALGNARTPRLLDDRGSRRFLGLVAVIVLAGSAMIGGIWASRQYSHPTLFDSWQNAYGIFDCRTEAWLPPLESVESGHGIRTRTDGIISIEPLDDSAAGKNAQLHVFLSSTGATLSDDTLTLPDGTVLSETGTFCNGEEAELQVMRWEADETGEPADVRVDDLAATRFLEDRETIAIVLAPVGAIVPIPPTAALLPEPTTPAFGSAQG